MSLHLPNPQSPVPNPQSPIKMVTLTLLDSQFSTPLQQWKFPASNLIRVGRSPENDVVINDPLVSRHHLELRQMGVSTTWRIINQGTNGTFINGILITQSTLADNALIQLARGGPRLKFQLQTPIQAPTPAPISPSSKPCTHEGNPPSNLFCIHCGQPIVSVQRFVHQYQILRTLGQGGMGTTYIAWEKSPTLRGRPQLVVLKEMNADMAKIAKAQELFEREARILKSLTHPGIPRYYDFFVEAGKKYLAMELIQGQNLEARIYERGPTTPSQAVEWMIQTCDVLGYIHQADPPLIHRDIKPANLMTRSGDNRVVVLDFGAVKEIGTPLGTRIGAEGYSAPEQDRGQPCTQSDLYAIGPTLIFLLTGENPLKYFRRRGSGYRFEIDSVPTITPRLAAAIDKVTEPKPRDRFQTAKQLAQALEACL